ncbi:MAG: flagellar motor protein MotB [Betaproteobacteria bacterium]|nr:flagellar motor protein MotB [Betaproteobacteria bacterium]
MKDTAQQPIIVKRIKKGGGGHHGGAWKIAYADFVTAMMAFFLLMWLLGSTAKGDLAGIAEYFQTPLKVALAGGEGSGDSSSILKGGGKDLTRTTGQVKNGETPAEKKIINLQAAKAELERQEKQRLADLKQDMERAIEASPNLRPFKDQLLLDITTEGLRIQVVDEKNRPMFDQSSADLKPYTRDILREIGRVLNSVPNRVSLTGHTDAKPYASGERSFSNWELSANRANASRRELVAGGMDERKLMRIVGLASTVLFDKQEPFNPINRRISIVVMNKKTEDAILQDGKATEVENAAQLDAETLAGAPSAKAGETNPAAPAPLPKERAGR